MELNQRNELIYALQTDFDIGTFSSMLWNGLDKKLADVVPPSGLTYPQTVETAVSVAAQEGWAWSMVEQALKVNPGSPYLKAFIAKHPSFDPGKGPPAIADALMAHMLRGGRCFIDRTQLRAALKELHADERRVLVVTGERQTGKTYTRELISFFGRQNRDQRPIYIDLDRTVYEALSLTQEIGALMGMDIKTIPPQDDEQKARWAHRLSGWIIARLTNPGDVNYWFIFDGFRERTLLPDTKEFIEQLAIQAETNVPQCRVVLLNYKENLPPTISDYVGREEITTIGRDELLDFFEQLNLDHQKKYAPADLTGKVDVILKQVDDTIADKPEIKLERLRLLNKAVNETARLLFV